MYEQAERIPNLTDNQKAALEDQADNQAEMKNSGGD
jgi:hypothetical protein